MTQILVYNSLLASTITGGLVVFLKDIKMGKDSFNLWTRRQVVYFLLYTFIIDMMIGNIFLISTNIARLLTKNNKLDNY